MLIRLWVAAARAAVACHPLELLSFGSYCLEGREADSHVRCRLSPGRNMQIAAGVRMVGAAKNIISAKQGSAQDFTRCRD